MLVITLLRFYLLCDVFVFVAVVAIVLVVHGVRVVVILFYKGVLLTCGKAASTGKHRIER